MYLCNIILVFMTCQILLRLVLVLFVALAVNACSKDDVLLPIEGGDMPEPSSTSLEYKFEPGKFLYIDRVPEWIYDPRYECLSVDLGDDISDIDSISFHIGGCNTHVGTVAFADKDFNILYRNANYDLKERTVTYKNLPEGARWLYCNSTLDIYNNPRCSITRKMTRAESPYKNLDGKNILMLGDSQTEFRYTLSGKGIAEYSGALIDPYYGTTKQRASVVRGGIGGSHLSLRQVKPEVIRASGDAYTMLDVPSIVDALIDQEWTLVDEAVTFLKTNEGDDNTPILENLKGVDLSEIDYITIFAGTNDWNSNVGLGKRGDTDNVNNFHGTINYITTRIHEKYPHIKVVFFTPVVRWMKVGDPAKWSDVYRNRASLTLVDVADAMLDACEYNNAPCCDLYRAMGWNMENFDLYFQDTTHCTKGFHLVAEQMMQFLNSLHQN